MDIYGLCQTHLSNVTKENEYISGHIDGDKEYQQFFTNLNNICGGFVRRDSHKGKMSLHL